jgi:hypothetical protein
MNLDNSHNQFKHRNNPFIEDLFILVIGLMFFFFILYNRYPFPLRPIAQQVRSGFTILLPAAFIIALMAYKIKGFWGKLFCFTFTLSLFALSLSGLWISGRAEPQVIGGLIPISDGAEYYFNSLRLLNGQFFSNFGSRPLFSSYLSSLLFFSGKNLQITIAIMVLINAICTYLATIKVRKEFGPLISTMFLLLLFFFFRRYTGKVMSENLGFGLGLIGFTLLLEGIRSRKKVLLLSSIFFFSFGLNARAGAFFILPFLILGVTIFLDDKKLNWRLLIMFSFISVLAFLINFLLLKVLTLSGGLPFSNFSYILYGMAHGGVGWTGVMKDHPELFSQLKPVFSDEYAKIIMNLALQAIKNNPLNFITGYVKELLNFVNFNSNVSIFSFVSGENKLTTQLVQVLLYILSFLGTYRLIEKRKEPFYKIFILALIGNLLSVPFVIADASYMRAFAVTVPFLILLPCFGIDLIVNRNEKGLIFKEKDDNNLEKLVYPVTGFIILSSIFLPLLFKQFIPPNDLSTTSCASGQELVDVEISEGSSVNVFPESYFFLDWLPNYHFSRFVSNLYQNQIFPELKPPFKLLSTINLINGSGIFLLFSDDTQFNLTRLYNVCGQSVNSLSDKDSILIFYDKLIYVQSLTQYG